MDDEEIKKIEKLLKKTTDDLKIIPSKIFKEDIEDYFISINIYNCSSPIFNFLTDEPATRCEINTYVKNSNNEKGTLIMDYASNILSMDPDNIFKKPEIVGLKKKDKFLEGKVECSNIKLDLKIDSKNYLESKLLSSKLIKLSDQIFYNNGLYDKLFYDSTLLNNKIIKCNSASNIVQFEFANIILKNIHSIFYFDEQINFVGGMWFNLNI